MKEFADNTEAATITCNSHGSGVCNIEQKGQEAVCDDYSIDWDINCTFKGHPADSCEPHTACE
jgi:hypothetical protein